jgi:hypothetical protein
MEIIRLRTSDNLLSLLKSNESWAWKVNKNKLGKISKVQICNWKGDQMIVGDFDHKKSRYEGERLVVAFRNAKIINSSVVFNGRNPINYLPDHTCQ